MNDDMKILSEFFTPKKDLEIKRQLIKSVHKHATGYQEMSVERLDKTVEKIRYILRVYDTSDTMSKQVNK